MSKVDFFRAAGERLGFIKDETPPSNPPPPPPESSVYSELDVRLNVVPNPYQADSYYTKRAFPSAEGFGANADWKKYGTPDITFVTNLNDSGTGSLRAAMESSAPSRVIIPLVWGYQLQATPIKPVAPGLYYAGQFMPDNSKGLVWRNGASGPGGGGRVIMYGTDCSDHIYRYYKAHRGYTQAYMDGDNNSQPASYYENDGDCITMGSTGSHPGDPTNVIFDHVDIAFSGDEGMGCTRGDHITVQHMFQMATIANGMHYKTHIARFESGKSNQTHGFGLLAGYNSKDWTIHHTLFTETTQRQPRITGWGTMDMVNNYGYNIGSSYMLHFLTNEYGNPGVANWVNNSWEGGPYGNMVPNTAHVRLQIRSGDGAPQPKLYLSGNSVENANQYSEWQRVFFVSGSGGEGDWKSTTRHVAPNVLTHNAPLVKDKVLDYGGASYVLDPETYALKNVKDNVHLLRENNARNKIGPSKGLDMSVLYTSEGYDASLPTGSITEAKFWSLYNGWAVRYNKPLNKTGALQIFSTGVLNIEAFLESLVPNFPKLT